MARLPGEELEGALLRLFVKGPHIVEVHLQLVHQNADPSGVRRWTCPGFMAAQLKTHLAMANDEVGVPLKHLVWRFSHGQHHLQCAPVISLTTGYDKTELSREL